MNKYDILERKLVRINNYIDTMHIGSEAPIGYLEKYKETGYEKSSRK